MYKKICLILILIITAFSLTSCVQYEEVIVGDFVYVLSDHSDLYYNVVGISEEGKEKKELVIPSEINGIPVTNIGYSFHLYWEPICNFESENLEILYFSVLLEINAPQVFKNCPNFKRSICLEKVNFNGEFKDLPNCVNQEIEKNGEYFPYTCYIYGDRIVKEWFEGEIYRPGNVVYFLNEQEDIYYIDFCENITSDNLPKDPKRDGYKFMGWYKEPECINEWDIKVDVLPEIKKIGDIIEYEVVNLYAKWEEIKY